MAERGAEMEETKPKKKRGFATWTPEKRAEVSKKGGIAAHAMGVAHRFTPEEAREAGRKGGLKTAEDRKYMSEIGSLGGTAVHRKVDKRQLSIPYSEEALADEQ